VWSDVGYFILPLLFLLILCSWSFFARAMACLFSFPPWCSCRGCYGVLVVVFPRAMAGCFYFLLGFLALVVMVC
jgi:hypothetical protein